MRSARSRLFVIIITFKYQNQSRHKYRMDSIFLRMIGGGYSLSRGCKEEGSRRMMSAPKSFPSRETNKYPWMMITSSVDFEALSRGGQAKEHSLPDWIDLTS